MIYTYISINSTFKIFFFYIFHIVIYSNVLHFVYIYDKYYAQFLYDFEKKDRYFYKYLSFYKIILS